MDIAPFQWVVFVDMLTMTILAEFEELENAWADCTDCRLHEGRTQTVWWRVLGDVHTEGLVIVGEAPGKYEDKEGEAFIGRAGRELDRRLVDAGINNAVIVNTVLCRPPGNRDPRDDEMAACWPRLQRTLELLKPRAIITVGKVPTNHLLDRDQPISSMLDKVYRWQVGDGIDAMLFPMYHPAYLMRRRDQHLNREYVARLEMVEQWLTKKAKS